MASQVSTRVILCALATVAAALAGGTHQAHGQDVAAAIEAGSASQTTGPLLHLVRRPMISGVGSVGARLTASSGAWSGSIRAIATRWERCTLTAKNCKTVSRHPNYRVVAADRGKGIHVIVRATGEDGVVVEAHSNLLPIRR